MSPSLRFLDDVTDGTVMDWRCQFRGLPAQLGGFWTYWAGNFCQSHVAGFWVVLDLSTFIFAKE